MWIQLFLLTQFFLGSLIIQVPQLNAPHLENGNDVINAVNAFRSAYGLAPYEIDESLMAIAQNQSNYQASINSLTHTRPDGSGAEVVSSENIALGSGQPIDRIMRQQWTKDYWHTVTLIGFSKGRAGAGVATGSDGLIYYTLDVINTGGKLTGLTVNALPTGSGAVTAGTPGAPAATSQPIHALVTTTPLADGSVYHTVLYGQTLWGISNAYNIPLKDLTSLNQIDPTRAVLRIGQQILIRPSFTPAPTLTPTAPPPAATNTLQPTPTHKDNPTTTPQLTPAPLISLRSMDKRSTTQISGIVLAAICIFGLSLALVGRILKRK